jgi:hypothetical protein
MHVADGLLYATTSIQGYNQGALHVHDLADPMDPQHVDVYLTA